jgi:hydrogenase maturation protease
MTPRLLVAGIGNIFLGDDGFGVEVVRRLAESPLDERVVVEDFGIRGMHLALDLSSGLYDGAILVDAMPCGGEPGTLYVIEPDAGGEAAAGVPVDAHSLTPSAVLAWVRHLGGEPGRILVVGCEPASVDESLGLSASVAAAVDDAVRVVRELLASMMERTVCA